MANRIYSYMYIMHVAVFITSTASKKEPCETNNFIDDWKRSVAYIPDNPNLCDSFLIEDWYRVVSGAGEKMPTSCPIDGWRCGTANPVWLSNEGVGEDEDIYPDVGETVDRTGLAVFDTKCDFKKYPIRIKNCGKFYVYYLKPVSGCLTAYCFGSELPCPAGQSSETGFTPNCGTFSNITVRPKISVTIHEEVTDEDVILTPKFECTADDATEEYTYDIRYYINDVEVDDATRLNVTFDDISQAVLLQKHWEKVFKPNMFVKCSMQVRAEGFTSPGNRTFSEQFFAGIRVLNSEEGFTVNEGEELKISVKVTMPVGCQYPVNSPENRINFYKNDQCFVRLFNAIPQYQKEKCENGIIAESLKFITERCGIKISHSKWNDVHDIRVRGECDSKINLRDRLTFLRLWSDPHHGSIIENLAIWNNLHLPDIKVLIKDTTERSLGRSCYSHNDPHMMTFDGRPWELQNTYNEPSPGEYIMYKHLRLPQQINAFFRSCNPHSRGSALCNCGVAIRSGDSLFVANFCETTYKGQRRVNRYVASWLCDDQNLVVEETGNKYKVILPSGTQVEFGHGDVYDFYGIHKIDIRPSQLDFDLTSGLCGRYNKIKDVDDFVHRKTGMFMNDKWQFAKSWKVDGTDETLFDPYKKLPEIKYNLQEYCTCKSAATQNNFAPEYDCVLSTEMRKCRQLTTTDSVYHASCLTSNYRTKRDVSNKIDEDNDEDKRPPMFPVIVEPDPDHQGSEKPIGWTDELTEEMARNKCQNAFLQTSALSICSEYVPSVKSENYVEECVNDMKILGDDSFLRVTLENFASSCLSDAKIMENLTASDTNTTDTNSTVSTNETDTSNISTEIKRLPNLQTILEVIEQSTCPQNCSRKGVCKKGVCVCNEGYFGVDCSVEKTKAPKIEKDAFEGVCDSSIRPCRKYIIPGLDFYPENLTCKFRSFQFVRNESRFEMKESIESFTHPGIYSSLFLMFCEIPEVRRKRYAVKEDVIAVGYYLSVSNDGINFTDELTAIAYDARCYQCNITESVCSEEFQDDCPLKPVSQPPQQTHSLYVGIGIAVGIIVVAVAIGIGIYIKKQKTGKTRRYELTEERISLTNIKEEIQRKNF